MRKELSRLIGELRNIYPEEESSTPVEIEISETELSPELISELEKQKSVWEELSQTLSINDIEDFANQMKELGRLHNCDPLMQWAEKLNEQAGLFDLDNMAETLGQYTQFLSK